MPPLVGVDRPGRVLVDRDARVADEQVDGAELVLDALDHRLDLGALRDVHRERETVDLGRDLLDLLGRPGGDGDAGAGTRELESDRAADAASATRHERDLTVEARFLGHRARS